MYNPLSIDTISAMQAVKSQQRDIDCQTSFTQKGLQHLNSKLIASQLGEGVDQESATAELSNLRESIHIIAHVAHAVAVNQLDMPEAHIQVPNRLTLSSTPSSSSGRQQAEQATAAADPPGDTCQRADGEASGQLVDRSSLRGSFKSMLALEPAKPTAAQSNTPDVAQSREEADQASEGPDLRIAVVAPLQELMQPSTPLLSGTGQQVYAAIDPASSMVAPIIVPSPTKQQSASPVMSRIYLKEGSAVRGASPISNMSSMHVLQVRHILVVQRMLPICLIFIIQDMLYMKSKGEQTFLQTLPSLVYMVNHDEAHVLAGRDRGKQQCSATQSFTESGIVIPARAFGIWSSSSASI